MDAYDFFVKVGIGGLILVGVGLVGGAGHHIGYTVSKNIKETRNKVEIERNIQKSAGFSKFTGRAFTATSSAQGNFVDIFGVAIKDAGGTPTFCSVSYEIDEALYEKIFKFVDIHYTYGPSGQLIEAEYEMRRNLSLYGGAKAKRARWDIFEKLVEVTKKNVKSINMFGPTENYSALENTSGDNQNMVTRVTAPLIQGDKISFEIDLLEDAGEAGFKLSTLKVKQKLTQSMYAHKEDAAAIALSRYGEGKKMHKLKLVNEQIIPSSTYTKLKIPAENKINQTEHSL